MNRLLALVFLTIIISWGNGSPLVDSKGIFTPIEVSASTLGDVINTNAEFRAVLDQKALNFEESFTLQIHKDLDVQRFFSESRVIYISEYSCSMLYKIDKNGKKIPQDNYTYEFELTYADDFKILQAFRNDNFISKLSETEKRALEKAKKILSLMDDSMSDYDKELFIHNYLVLNGKYDTRIYTNDIPESSYFLEGLLLNGTGVCQSYAKAMYLLLNMAEVECVYVFGTASDSSGKLENHAWNKVKLDGEWYNVDTTWDDPIPDKPNVVDYTYFNVTDKFLSRDHQWDTKMFSQVAEATKYNFYVYNKLIAHSYEEFKEVMSQEISKYSSDDSITVSIYLTDYKKSEYDLNFLFALLPKNYSLKYSSPSSSEGVLTIMASSK